MKRSHDRLAQSQGAATWANIASVFADGAVKWRANSSIYLMLSFHLQPQKI